MTTYGQEMRAARIKKGKTMQELATSCSTFKGYVCGIEKDTLKPPSERMTRRFSRVLGLDVDRMLALAILQKRKNASLKVIFSVCQELLTAPELAKEAS